jgi:ABC-2 type transport system ATP-binding protein
MRRRLDLAAGLVTRPAVLFLDEPTTGLDPTGRLQMWDVIRDLIADGVTLLLTTQYLDEADELADQIVVVDHGRAIASGTAGELKAQTGGARLEVTLQGPHPAAIGALGPLVAGVIQVSHDGRRLRAPVRSGAGLATAVVRALDEAGVTVDDVEVHQPSLDDVFFALTGHPTADVQDGDDTMSESISSLVEVAHR